MIRGFIQRSSSIAALAGILLSGCKGGPAADPSASTGTRNGASVAAADDPYEGSAPPEDREAPPPPGLTPDWSFPKIEHGALDNGLALRVVPRNGLPLVDIDLVILSGSASDGDKPGLGVLAGELLKAGGAGNYNSRELLERAESLGSSIDITTDRDSTRISMAVTSNNFQEALDIIAAVAVKPRMNAEEFLKLKRREMDRVSSLARTSAAWAASMVLYRELYELPSGVHPYSRFDATAPQIERLQLEDCRKWHREHVTPKNAVLVVSGNVTQAAVSEAAKRAFAGFKGEAPEKAPFTEPVLSEKREVFLVDRPDSPQAEVYVATLGPERQSETWPELRVANQVLGGGVAGRLFLDVREKRSLAYRTNSSIDELANGPVPIVLAAGTQTPKAAQALAALLEHFEGLGKAAPTERETAIATRYLSDIFLLSVDTVSAINSLTARLSILRLPDDYYDRYRARVREVKPEQVNGVASRYFRPRRAVIVVAGDAKQLGRPLSAFGPVEVVDPDNGFVTKSKIAHDPTAATTK